MMTENRHTLTLHRTAKYRITVPGHLDDGWIDWAGEMTLSLEQDNDGLPVTTLTGALDQAALQGLLRRLYSLGLPLISVAYLGLV